MQNLLTIRYLALLVIFPIILSSCSDKITTEPDKEKREKILEHLLTTFSSYIEGEEPKEAPVWESWLRKTKELPPDFDKLPTNAFPPDLLTLNDGNLVNSPEQWSERREEINEVLKKYMFGNWPPPPAKTAIKYQSTKAADNEEYYQQNVQLWFAPSVKAVEFAEETYNYNPSLTPGNRGDRANQTVAILNAELFIPKGRGPFPSIVEIGPSNIERDLPRIRRGYIVVRFSRLDADYIAAVYTDYECNQLEWWAYAAGRCVDMLYTRDDIDKLKIALAGHSRGAKTGLLAMIMDDRVSALLNSHPGTGAGSYNIWRYAGEKYGGENLDNSTRRFQYWNNPRMRFFIGRTNKMPFDSHSLLALAAPRPVLLGTGELDNAGQAWGDQQCYMIVKEVYKLLGNENKLGFYASPGGHTVTPQMVNDELDWLDMQLGRKPFDFPEKLIYTYSFDKWTGITGEKLNINEFPEKDTDDILTMPDGKEVRTSTDWETKSVDIKDKIRGIIGELPEYASIDKVTIENKRTFRQDFIKAEIQIDDKLTAHMTYPADRSDKIPVVIYLHAYLDAQGYNWSRGYGYRISVGERLAQNGFLAIEFDQFGYASRNRDSGIEFYESNPERSALEVMIQDVSKIIDAVGRIDWVDKDKIMVAGYSLGGMVGLYSAVFDGRIKAVASACGFGSMRRDVHENETEGIKRYSHLRPTIPRLGLFLGNEKKIPYDFHEIIGLIAPRPVFILAPQFDQDWYFEDVEICYKEAQKIFKLYGKEENLVLESPDDFNRYPPEYQEMVNNWLVSAANK
jgi:dienelactone hydrolase